MDLGSHKLNLNKENCWIGNKVGVLIAVSLEKNSLILGASAM